MLHSTALCSLWISILFELMLSSDRLQQADHCQPAQSLDVGTLLPGLLFSDGHLDITRVANKSRCDTFCLDRQYTRCSVSDSEHDAAVC